MKILITGNMGYVGTGVVSQLRSAFPEATLIGYDMAYFASSLANATVLPESRLDQQIFGDVRNMPAEVLEGIDAVVHLAAISEDPAGNTYDSLTHDVNYTSSIRIAELAKALGVESFIYASTCSMYGAADESVMTEVSEPNPLSTYARTKMAAEVDLEPLAGDGFKVTCLRFPTACGMSERPRLGLVLNDFVAEAVTTGNINLQSDGASWQPLIHLKDMALAIEWAVTREAADGGEYLVVNAGSDSWNFRLYDLAIAVADAIPGTTVNFKEGATPDSCSYRVKFDLFKALAPDHQPKYSLQQTITELRAGFESLSLKPNDCSNSLFNRLLHLNKLQEQGTLNHELCWAHQKSVLKREPVLEILD